MDGFMCVCVHIYIYITMNPEPSTLDPIYVFVYLCSADGVHR